MLGLADPVICNRFVLWGRMGIAAVTGVVLNVGAVMLHVNVLTSPAMPLVSSLTGMAQTVCLVLAFVPPRAYLERVRSRAAVSAS